MQIRSVLLAISGALLLACGSDHPTSPSVPVVASVVVTPGADTVVTLGHTRQYAAQARDASGAPMTGVTFIWRSSNPSVATVDSLTGLATAAQNGLADIRATAAGISGTASLTVAQVVATVQVTPGTASFSALGVTQAFGATARDSGGASIAGVRFLWISSSPGVASVDTSGIATSRGPGTATLSATGRGIPGYAGITVTQAPRQLAFSIQPTSIPAGDAISPAVQVEIRDSAGTLVGDARNAVTIGLAANPGGASLGGTQIVNAVNGIATFSGLSLDRTGAGYTLAASASGLTGATSGAFNVGQGSATTVVVTPGSGVINALGRTKQFTAQVRDRQGNPVAGAVVRWRSSDNSVATIDSMTGLASAQGNGVADLIASSGAIEGRGSVAVNQVVASVSVTPSAHLFVALGDTLRLAAAATDSNGHAVSGVPVLWGSSNPAAAPVDTLGLVRALTRGSASISALARGIPGYAGISVTQVPARFALTSQPQNRVAGVTLPSISANLLDANGHLIDTTINGIYPVLAVNPGPDTLPYVFTGTIHGVATFFNLALTKAANGYRLAFSYPSVASDTTVPFNITPGPAAHLLFTQGPPSLTQVLVPFGPITATGNDMYGNAITSDTVTLRLRGPWANARLLGTVLDTTIAGVATYSSVKVDKPGTGYRLVARQDSTTAFAAHVTFTTVATGNGATCGSTSVGGFCWGFNGSGVLGESRYGNDSVPGPIDSAFALVQASVGGAFACGRSAGGAAYCWGQNGSGQLGRGTIGSFTSTPAQVSGSGSGSLVFTQISSGLSSTCGVTTGHAVYCWGDNFFAELGDSTLVNSGVPVLVKGTGGGGLQFAQVSVGYTLVGAYACGVTTGNVAYCWGINYNDVLGSGSANDTSRVPRAVIGGHAFNQIAAGGRHTCALDTGGAAFCWGANDSLELGAVSGTTTTPQAVTGGLTFTSISAGGDQSCAITGPKALYCWGGNGYGQLGDGTTTKRGSPTLVLGGYVWTAVSAGVWSTCGITGSGAACIGRNDLGQLGDGSQTNRHQPALVVQ